MLRLRKILLFVIMITAAVVLMACNPNGSDLPDDSLITSIYIEDGHVHVNYLDGSTKDLGMPQKNSGNEPGIVKVSFGGQGELLIEYSNGEIEEVGYLIGSSGDLVEYELRNNHLRWRFAGSGNAYQNLISVGLLTSQDLRNNVEVVFTIEDNQIKWKDIADNEWNSLMGYITFGMMLGITNVSITDVVINENNDAIITFGDGTTYVLNLPIISYTVTFKDENGDVISTHEIGSGFSVEHPVVEERPGYTVQWDHEGQNITEDTEIQLIYTPNHYQISYDYPNTEGRSIAYNSEIGFLPVPVKEGHEFLRWETEDGEVVDRNTVYNYTEDITLYPVFKALPNESYVVNVYKLDPVSGYVLISSDVLEADLGDEVSADAPEITGYHLNTSASNAEGVVLEDGALELNLYMDNNLYIIHFDVSEVPFELSDTPPDEEYDVDYEVHGLPVLYERPIGLLPLIYMEDHVFLHWVDDEDNVYNEGDIYLLLDDLTLYPVFAEGKEYIVQYYYWTHIGNQYIHQGQVTKFAPVGSTITAEYEVPHGFKIDEDQSVLELFFSPAFITPPVLKVYFAYDTFEVNYLDKDGGLLISYDLPYLTQIANYTLWPRIDGYNFEGWRSNGAIIPFGTLLTEDITLQVSYTNTIVGYRIYHVLLDDIENKHDPIDVITETFTTTSFTYFTGEPKDIPGYVYDEAGSFPTNRTESEHYVFNASLYYVAIQYEASFMVDGGEVDTDIGIYDANVVFPDDPVKEGQVFKGWYLDNELVSSAKYGIRDDALVFEARFEDEEIPTAVYYVDYFFESIGGGYFIKGGQQFEGVVGELATYVLLEDLMNPPIALPDYLEFDETNSLNVLEGTIIENIVVEPNGAQATHLLVHYSFKDYQVIYTFGDETVNFTHRYNETFDIGQEMLDQIADIERDYHVTFDGWVLNLMDEPAMQIENYTMSNEDLYVYGVFSDYLYTVLLIDGIEETEIKAPFSGTVNLPVLAHEYDSENGVSHDFLGWMNEDNSMHVNNFIFEYEDDIVLYAKWNSTGNLWKTISGVRIGHSILHKYLGRNIDVVIPEIVGSRIIEGAWTYTFKDNGYVQNLVIKPGVYHSSSLGHMPRLKTVTFEGDLSRSTRIGDNAFWRNPSLESVDFSNAVMTWGRWVFRETPSLKEVKFPIGFQEIPEYTFADSGLEEITLPDTITVIGKAAFMGTKLTNIVIPISVFEIKQHAFAISTLESITFLTINPMMVEDAAFGSPNNEVLQNVVVPRHFIRNIGDQPFITKNPINIFVNAESVPAEWSSNQNVYVFGEWAYIDGNPIILAN